MQLSSITVRKIKACVYFLNNYLNKTYEETKK